MFEFEMTKATTCIHRVQCCICGYHQITYLIKGEVLSTIREWENVDDRYTVAHPLVSFEKMLPVVHALKHGRL